MPPRTLELGTLFKGTLDPSFLASVEKIKSLLGEMSGVMATTTREARAQRSAMSSTGSELSQYQMLMGRATSESVKFQQALSQIASKTQGTGIALQQAWNAVAKGEKALANLGMQMDAQGGRGETFARKMDLAAVSQDMLSNKLTVSKGRFVQLADGISTASRAAVNASNRYSPLITSTRLMNDEVALAATGFQKFAGTFKNAIGTMVAWGPAAMVVYGGMNALQSAFREIIAFDQGLANLKAISNDTDAAVARMGETIIDIADKTRYSATDIAGAMTLIAQAGFSAGESIEVVKASALLASGTLEKINVTADLLTSTIRAFNLDATEAGRVADVYAAALNYTKLNVDNLRTAMNYLGPAAYASGLSLEEAAAAAGILADSGMRASTIGTNLRQMLARLIAPSKKLRETFQEYGIELSKVNPLTNDFSTVIENLSKVIPNSQRAFELFGLRAANAVLVLTRVGSEGFKVMLDNLMTVGNASTMAEKQMQGLGAMLENLMAKAKNLMIAIGEGGLATAMRILIEAVKPVIDVITFLVSTSLGKFVIALGLVSTATYGLIAALRALVATSIISTITGSVAALAGWTAATYTAAGATGVLTGAWNVLKTAMLTHPFVALAVGIGTAIVAIKSLGEYQARTTLEAEKNAIQYQRNIDVLDKYKNKLDGVKEGSMGHANILARLAQEFPELTQKIEESGTSIEKQKELIDELSASQKALALENLETALKGETKAFEELNMQIARAKENMDFYANYNVVQQALMAVSDAATGNLRVVDKLKVMWYEFKAAMGGSVPPMTQLQKELNDLSASQKKTKQTLGELSVDYTALTGKKWNFGNLYIPEATVKAMYDLRKAIKETEKSWEEMDEAGRRSAQAAMIADLGDKWVELYNRLDDAGKAHVAHYAAQAEAKMQQVEASALKEKLTAEQVSARKQEVADKEFTAMVQKEQQKNQALISEYQKYLQDYQRRTGDHQKALKAIAEQQQADLKRSYEERLRKADDVYKQELTKLELSKKRESEILKEKNRLHDQHYRDVLQMYRDYMSQQLGMVEQEGVTRKAALERDYNAVVTGLQREANEYGKLKGTLLQMEREKENGIIAIDRETINAKRAVLNEILSATRAHINELKQEYQSLASEIRGIDEKLLGYKEELISGERKIRQSAMSEDKKYADNLKEYQRLIAEAEKARYAQSWQEAEKYYKEAAQLAEGMTGEVKNAGGQVVVTAEQNASKLALLFRQAMEGYKVTLEAHRSADKSRMDELMGLITDLTKLEDEVKRKITEISTEELRINTDAAKSAVGELQGDLDKLEETIKKLDGSRITIYKDYVEGSGGESGESSGSDTGETSGWSEGGKLPGYGGGDIVDARLEPGEFVVRKEAVKRYGVGFLAALNNLALNLPETFKRYLKGNFGNKPNYALGYAQGGLVGRSESITLRLQVGDAELPVTVAGKNPKQMVKDFTKELTKVRMTRVR